MKKSTIAALAASTMLFSMAAQAVPWCYRGTIVQIADVQWSEAQILANFYGTVPSGVADPEVYIASHASNNYASLFAGGGGGFGGYSVPGSGTVRVIPYAPHSLVGMVGPGYYFTNQGMKFKMQKCYTIPPMVAVKEKLKLTPEDPGSDIVFDPLPQTENIRQYWQKAKDIKELSGN